MKSKHTTLRIFIATLTTCLAVGVSSAASADPEIQVFINYRGANDYDGKVVSTWDRPASAALVHVEYGETPLNGACFRGNPYNALALFDRMVQIFNLQAQRSVSAWGDVYFDQELQAPALIIYERDETGRVTTWFPRMRQCLRWSTPEERGER